MKNKKAKEMRKSQEVDRDEVLERTLKKREEYIEWRSTKTDNEVVEARKEGILGRNESVELKEIDEADWEKNIRKFEKILDSISERSEYDIWERIKVRYLCRSSEESKDIYRVKANQKGRTTWIKSLVEKYGVEMRSNEPMVLSKGSKEREEERDPTKEENQKFWKYYLEEEEKLAKNWKRGVLHKKSIRSENPMSWDIEAYNDTWLNNIRVTNSERRYVLTKKTWKDDMKDINRTCLEANKVQLTGGYRVSESEYGYGSVTTNDGENIHLNWGYEMCNNKERRHENTSRITAWGYMIWVHMRKQKTDQLVVDHYSYDQKYRKGITWLREDRTQNMFKGDLCVTYREDMAKLSGSRWRKYKGWSMERGLLRYKVDKRKMYMDHVYHNFAKLEINAVFKHFEDKYVERWLMEELGIPVKEPKTQLEIYKFMKW